MTSTVFTNSTVFVTYGSGRFLNSLRRITKEAKTFNYFDAIYPYDNESIKELDNYHLIKPFIDKYQRGNGYWIWKPFIILDTLKKLKVGDYLFYADAGCHLNLKGKRTLDVYKKAISDKYDVIGFQMKHLLECYWTKASVFEHLEVVNNKEVTHTGQIIGGVQVIRKTEESVKFVERWLATCLTGDLITDAPCENKYSHLQLKDHRHDQSVQSVLKKLYPRAYLVSDHTFAEDGDWDKLANIPIQARRLR